MFRIALYNYYVIIIIYYVAVARSAYNLSSIVSKFKLNNEYNIIQVSFYIKKVHRMTKSCCGLCFILKNRIEK